MSERRKSQNARILDYMKRGNWIDSKKAQDLFGCDRLSARIHDLRYKMKVEGIKDRLIFKGSMHYSVYWIDQKAA